MAEKKELISLENVNLKEIFQNSEIKLLHSLSRVEGLILATSKFKVMETLFIKEIVQLFKINELEKIIFKPEDGDYKNEEIERIVDFANREAIDHQIIVIVEGEKISKKLFDKLLITLEEPKKNTTFLLLAENIESVPNTIIGRANVKFNLNTIKGDYFSHLNQTHSILLEKVRYDIEIFNQILEYEMVEEVLNFFTLIENYQEKDLMDILIKFNNIADNLKIKPRELCFRWDYIWKAILIEASKKEKSEYIKLKEGYQNLKIGNIYNSNLNLLLLNFLSRKYN